VFGYISQQASNVSVARRTADETMLEAALATGLDVRSSRASARRALGGAIVAIGQWVGGEVLARRIAIREGDLA